MYPCTEFISDAYLCYAKLLAGNFAAGGKFVYFWS